jgi:hypothetical protein
MYIYAYSRQDPYEGLIETETRFFHEFNNALAAYNVKKDSLLRGVDIDAQEMITVLFRRLEFNVHDETYILKIEAIVFED